MLSTGKVLVPLQCHITIAFHPPPQNADIKSMSAIETTTNTWWVCGGCLWEWAQPETPLLVHRPVAVCQTHRCRVSLHWSKPTSQFKNSIHWPSIELWVCIHFSMCRRQAHYRFCWYLPLVGLKVQWSSEQLPSSECQMKISKTRAKMYQLKQALQQHMVSKRIYSLCVWFRSNCKSHRWLDSLKITLGMSSTAMMNCSVYSCFLSLKLSFRI